LQVVHTKRQNWPLQRRPGHLIMRLQRLMTRFAERRFQPLGFGVASYPVLTLLTENEHLTQKELTALLQVEQSSMAQLLGRLERDGLIARTRDPRDGRSSLISLTAKARQALPALASAIDDGNNLAVAGMTDAEIEQALDLLTRMIANMEAEEDREA
jgi:DNA-binding MarR family transcriptional regulator